MPRDNHDAPQATAPADPTESRASSRGSWAAGRNPFVADAGPRFDPEAAQEAGPVPLHVLEVAWEPGRIKTMVRAQGLLTHDLVGVGEQDWLWKEHELEALAEPMANTLNKIPATRAAAAVSDELTVGAVMFEYAARSIRERRQVLVARKRAEQAQQPRVRPVTGYNAAGEKVSPGEVNWEVPE